MRSKVANRRVMPGMVDVGVGNPMDPTRLGRGPNRRADFEPTPRGDQRNYFLGPGPRIIKRAPEFSFSLVRN